MRSAQLPDALPIRQPLLGRCVTNAAAALPIRPLQLRPSGRCHALHRMTYASSRCHALTRMSYASRCRTNDAAMLVVNRSLHVFPKVLRSRGRSSAQPHWVSDPERPFTPPRARPGEEEEGSGS